MTVHHHHAAVPLWRDVRVLRVVAQIVVALMVGAFIAFMAANFASAVEETGLGFGFSFLTRQAGFDIPDTILPYSARDTYLTAFTVGLANTLFVSLIGIVLATILGVVVGVARLSPNWLLGRIAGAYVEIMRNTPLLLQLVLLYFVVFLQLPGVRESFSIGDAVFLNSRGLYLPGPIPTAGFAPWIGTCLTAVVVLIASRVVAGRREDAGRSPGPLRIVGPLAFVALVALGWLVTAPMTFEVPVLGNFNFSGGIDLSTGFTALLTGLVIYTAAFIGEVVRGGIQAVRAGQVEAARALGLSERQVLRMVVFPQALRIIVPPLTSQYLNLTKNSSLAIAVGYPDLFKIGQTMSNQTGQPLPVIVLMMGTYLAISLATSLLMNLYNRRVQVAER